MKQGSRFSLILFVAILLASILMLGAGMAIFGRTIVKWWIPVAIALVPAILTAPLLMRRWEKLSDIPNRAVNIIIHIFVGGSVLYFALLGLNMAGADVKGEHVETTTVIQKYSKEHTRYRRVGRGRNIPNGTYKTYHIVLEFSDGRLKEQELPLSSYRNVRTGQHRDLKVARGLFGMPVIEN